MNPQELIARAQRVTYAADYDGETVIAGTLRALCDALEAALSAGDAYHKAWNGGPETHRDLSMLYIDMDNADRCWMEMRGMVPR